jgi:hypothetical protein
MRVLCGGRDSPEGASPRNIHLLGHHARRLLCSTVYQSAMQHHRFSDQIECGYVNDLSEFDLLKADH